MHFTEITQDFAGLDETNLPRHGTRAQWSAGNGRTWAIVLAGGAGTRLRLLTMNPAGIPVPKQYCSLDSGPSLLQQALARAFSVVPRWRTSVVVAEQQVQWWGPLARELPGTVAVQPEDRGTAIGILHALVRILERDPNARVVILPADHHVIDERALTRSLRNAIGALLYRHAEIVCSGLAPEGPIPSWATSGPPVSA
jgi:mannose-1-phosphate guanylyltransferase